MTCPKVGLLSVTNSSKPVTTDLQFILASASPRRLDLLAQIGLVPDLVLPADVDEEPAVDEPPRAYALRMATSKLETVRVSNPAAVILAADTVVAVGRRILPKTETEEEAIRCLNLVSGRRHQVLGAIAVAAPNGKIRTRIVATVVKFKRLHQQEIDSYIEEGEWRGKAGGYAIQGSAAKFIPFISGSYTNVVGLSLPEASTLLNAAMGAQSDTTAP
jgi:septum formation protein